jgi:hypothetical protein
MEIAIILALLLVILLPSVILIIGIRREKKKRIEERDEMFYEGEVKFGENSDGSKVAPSNSIDVVDELSKTLTNELEKATKPKKKKPAKKKKPEFPVEPVIVKPKSKRGRKPKNKDKKGGDDMLLS